MRILQLFKLGNQLLKFREKREKKKRQKEEDSGYKYAASELLKGTAAYEIYSHVECSHTFDDYNSFDEGVEQALEDWKKKTGEGYNTIL